MYGSGEEKWVENGWGEREGSSQDSACSTVNWSSVLMEELMERNVIPNNHMAMLKEINDPEVNPTVISDLRHNKDVRSTFGSSRTHQSNVAVMMEAKRILRKEEKAQKLFAIQDEIVSNEVNKFENHIMSLRKMNQRLERIAFPAVRKRPARLKNVHLFSKSACKSDFEDEFLPAGRDNSDQVGKSQSSCDARKSDKHQHIQKSHSEYSPTSLNGHISLSISGNKMDENEILQHNPLIHSQAVSEYHNTVFEKIHHKYIESERNRILKEGTAFIRHSSPVNDVGKDVKHAEETKIPSISNDRRFIQLGVWAEDSNNASGSIQEVAEETGVFMNEWTLPVSQENMNTLQVSSNESVKVFNDQCPVKKKEEKKDSSSVSLPPPIPMRKSSHNKLESMSKMYAKWMTKVCVSSSKTKCEEKHNIMELRKDRHFVKEAQRNSISREEKIMQVLNALQKQKDGEFCDDISKCKTSCSRFSRSVNDIHEEKETHNDNRFRRAISGTYEHRLKAHKELISHQKVKLEEQKKQIEDLKLAQLRIEHEKSQMITQKALNEVLETCNGKLRAQAKSLKSSLSIADLSPGNDFLLRMEQRANEQKQRKVLAHERRKKLEEERKRKIKEKEELNRLQEEELIKKKHHEAQELRRKEREKREEARIEKEKWIALERKADHFCQRRRLKFVISGLKKLVTVRRNQEESAEEFYEKYLMRCAIRVWKGQVDLKVEAKMDCADNFYRSKLLHRSFDAFIMGTQEKIRSMQVAVDMHDFHLQEKYFQSWLEFTRVQQEIEATKNMKADLHFCKTLLRQCLRQWQKYPQVAQLEREKERRKMMWRNKVQQLLPDFRPMLSSD